MKTRMLLAVVAAALLATGCLVEVEKVADPGPAFAEARRQAARVEGRSGPADHLKLLVYDRADGELVRVSVPMGIVEHLGDEEIDLGSDLDADTEKLVRRRLRFSDLENAPLGPLVEVDEEDGDQVLVWLQ
jgi:hypothetical protein